MTALSLSGVRWPLVVAAGVLSEVVVIALLSIIIVSYRFVVAPGRDAAAYQAFGHRAGYYVAPAAAGVATLLLAVWAGGRLTAAFVLNGFFIGLVGALCAMAFIFGARPEERPMYVVSYVLRIAGGIGGGLIAAGLAK